MKEDFISGFEHEDQTRLPYMDAKPEPQHNRGHFDQQFKQILDENRSTKESIYHDEARHNMKLRLEALNRLAQTEDGYRILRWLCEHLSFKGSVLAMVNGQVDTKSMLFNEARRLVWQDIRNMLTIPNRNRLEEDV